MFSFVMADFHGDELLSDSKGRSNDSLSNGLVPMDTNDAFTLITVL